MQEVNNKNPTLLSSQPKISYPISSLHLLYTVKANVLLRMKTKRSGLECPDLLFEER